MTHNPLIWIGLAGVDAQDNPRARSWQQRLHGLMIGVALLSLPAYVLDSAGHYPALQQAAVGLDVLIFVAFLLETGWMLHVTSSPGRYLAENWLNGVILIGTAASAMGAATEWVVLLRIARVALGSLVLLRALAAFKVLFTRRGAPVLLGIACLLMLAGGGVFYWVEPTVDNYWDGLWLAFVTGTTLGYGDFVPTSPPARVFAVFTAFVGVAMMTLFTANVVSYFIGRNDAPAAANDRAAAAVIQDLALTAGESARLLREMQTELRTVRAELAEVRRALGLPRCGGKELAASEGTKGAMPEL
ncbi:MAG: ion channel [Betaproteobacteria bacterium]